MRLDELEDGSADGVTAALLGFEDGLGFDVDVESGGFEDFAPDAAPAVNMSMVEKRDRPYVRPSEPGERLFRFDDRPPEEIYKVGGFHPRAPENLTQIWDWAKFTNSPSQFVSTTRNPKLWFKGKRYRYEIDTSLMEDSCGIDINITMAKEKDGKRLPKSWRNHYPHEREVAFTGSIPAEAVVSVYDGHEEREGTWPPASGEVEWPANGEEQQDAMLPSPDQLGQPGGGPEPTGVPYVTESAPPAPVGFVPAGADESEASSDPSGLSGTSSADGSDGNEMASPGAMPALSHEQADGPMVTAGNPAGLDPESGAAGANPDDDESSAMADLQSAMVTAIAQEEDDGAWPGRPAPGRPELGKNVALAVGLPTGGEDSSGQAGGAGVPSVGPGVLPGDSSGLGELLGSGEVRTDRWLPYGVNPGRSDEERSGSNRRRDGERPVEPFEFIVAPDGRRRVQRPDGRRGRSGERTEVGYDWEWYAGDRPGQETIRLTRRLFLEDQNADPARVAAMRLRLAAFMEQVNREGNRLKVLQPDQVTGPQLPGPRVQFAVEFVGSKDRAHQEVQVRDGLPGGARDMVQNRWYTDVHPAAHFHEVFHGYGPRDDDASEKVLLTPGGRSTQVLSAGESSLMGKFENLQSRIVITSDHLQQIADILTPYLPYGVRAFTDRVPADGAAGGEADAVVVRPAAEPATESVALSDGASPGETQEAPVSGDTAPSVDYRMVHEPDRDHVVESSVTASETTADQSVHTTERQPRPTMGARAGDQQSMAPSDGGLDHEPTEPGEDSAGVPDAGQQRIVFARIETALEVHRPPRIDHSMPSPSLEGGPVRFDDDSRLPEYLTGDGADDTKGRSYGHSQVTLRGADLALQEISEIVSTHLGGEASTVPGLSEVLADLSQAMRTVPQRFHGDGYQSSAFGNSPIRVLRVVTRPYGNWERFTDLHGEPAKLEVAQRSQVTAGAVQSVGTGRRAARGVSVLPAPGAAAFARLGVTAGSTRTAEYGMQDETVSQVETRTAEASHLHLDDVAYEVSLSGAPETVSSGGRPAGSSTTGETFTFAVRNGLAVRLADSETLAADPGRVPDRMELDERSDYRLVHTEGYGPVRGLAEQLVDGFGAVPGSAAYEYITEFLTSENFHRAADRLAKGNVPSDPLFAEDGSPLGAFVVEKVVPGEAELLTESRAAEMRHTIQQTATNERTLSTTSSRGVNLTLGPSFGLGPLGSLMAGPSVGYDRSSTHSSTFGGSGGRKIVGRAKNVPTVLYKVQKTVHVRRTGGEVITFDTWSLDRMTHTEARRLAGWDDGTTLRKREPANEPYAPAYLTKDRPAVLGMSRPEAFLYDSDLVKDEDQQKSWLQAFTDRVIGSAAKTYPDLLAPLEDFGDPNHSRWRDREHYNLALRNTLRVMNALSHHRMAGSLEELMTGLVIELDVVPGIVMRPRLSIRIRGVLTGRRYEGTQNDLILRHSAPGTERLDGSQSTTHTRELGTDVSLWGFADTANVSGGYTRRGQNGRGTQYGATASQEQLAISSLPSHLHSYRLELTAEIGGFWRYRSGPRALTLGWLGRQHYLQDEGSTDLVGGSADEFVGRVVLAVPDEYTPATDPDVAESAVAIEAVELDPAHTRALATRNAAVVSEGHGPDVFGDQPHQTLGVGTDERLMGVAVDLMRTASGASWHFSRPGALPHDAIVRFLQPQLLTGGFDQRSGPVGSRISVIAKGHWRDRVGELVHRMRILNLRVASGPIKLETETGVSSDLRMAESVTAATSSGWTLSGGGTTGGTELSTIVGVQYRRGSSRTESTKVTRTVTSDINRDDSGYKILLSGDVQHDIVASVRPEGFLGPYRDRFNGKQLTFPSSYLGQVPEKAAHQLGILKDGLGDVPRYVSHQWAQTTWWHDHPFGSYPVNSLDTSKVLAAFDEQLQRWNVDEADRERVHSLVTPRAVRALREQMTSTGAAARTRVGRWRTPFIRIGSRAGSLRVELIAGESEFVGLDHGVVMEDTRIATVTRTDGGSSVRSRGMGLTAMQQVATVAPGSEPGLGGPESLRPQFGVQTTSSDLTSHGRSRARTKRHIFYAREPHADYRTPYTLRLTLDLGRDKPTLTEEGPVGTLREQVPLSLSVARIGQTDDVLGPPSLDDPSGSVVLWPQDGAVLRHIAAWRSARQPHGAQGPIQLPSSGFHVRRIVGLETLREAGVLAIATAYGSSVAPAGSPLTLTGKDLADALEEARSTGLTRPGTGSALALDNATGDAALAAFFEDSATAAGYEVPGLNEGGSTGDYRLYSGPDFTRATLLAVIPVSTMESAERHSAGRAGAEEHTSGFEYSLGGRAAFAANDAGSVAPSASMAGPSTAEAGGQVIAGQESAQFNTKVAGRSFVFAIPTDWLGVAEVTRSSPFGPITSRPQAVETQGKIIALVHEDVARELGLINDENFPSRVADAWTQVVKAGQAWTDADSAYWEQRRALADLQGEERKRKRASMKDLPRRAKTQAAMNHLLQQADAAAKEFHRVRAAADRLTRWHQLPAEAHQAGESELRAGQAEPPAVVFQPVPVAETDSADAERYIVRESTPDGPGRLISPGGDHYTVHDVPTDGDAFFHALAEAVHHAAPDRLTARVDVADRQKIIDGLRRLLADELSNPGARGLLKFTSPDTKDTFSASDLAASGVDFREGSPERREYEDSGHIPLHAELPAEQRQRLARTQLLRRGDTEEDAGWNHGAADLQPSLAARVFNARITVVRADGAFQDFRPLDTVGEGTDEELVHRVPDEELVHMVLLSKDGHYLPALPSGDLRREPPLPAPAERDTIAAALQTGTPSGQGLRPAYSTPPWERGATSTWRAVVTNGKPATLVDPDGTVHELREPPGDGNGFWSGIADALELVGATASAAEVRQQSIPTFLRLDREWPFTDEELVRAGLSENGILTARLRRADGRIPADFELTRSQEEALIRQQVFTPRRWDDVTERNAAELAAARGLTLTVVAEDGTSRTHAPGDGTSGPRVILWRRGRDYLRAERPMPDPKLVDLLNEPAFVETRVRREHLEAVGLSFSPEEATMWLLAPEIMLQEFQLSVENREALLRAHPDDLFPASVRDAYKRLGSGENA
ncbi:hypothetical protein ADK58_36705 [Streptomyces sp. XY152]|nr:hypothetical protein ADK58_36705 [Streptomyces sp. XY152]